MEPTSPLPANLSAIDLRIRAACARAGRDPADIRLIWVSKNHPRESVLAALRLGARYFGENRVQEVLEKFPLPPAQVPADPAAGAPPSHELHFIGRLQKNKIRKVLPLVSALHSIDSPELLEAVNRVAGEMGLVRDVFLQVNTSREEAKGGFAPETLLRDLQGMPPPAHLRLVGLMTMGPADGDPARSRSCFRELAGLLPGLRASGPPLGRPEDMRWLSMGMSGDFETAIEEGAHYIRIGTGLFGARPAGT